MMSVASSWLHWKKAYGVRSIIITTGSVHNMPCSLVMVGAIIIRIHRLIAWKMVQLPRDVHHLMSMPSQQLVTESLRVVLCGAVEDRW